MNKHFYFLLQTYESLRIFNIHGGSIFIDFKGIIQSRNKIINNFFLYISTYHQVNPQKNVPMNMWNTQHSMKLLPQV